MTYAVNAAAVGALVLGTAVWLGGFVTITVVTLVARRTLEPSQAIGFFRTLGRVYGGVATGALVLGLAGGATLLRDHRWDARMRTATILAAALVAATATGVVQARAMTRLRRVAVATPNDVTVTQRVARSARGALLLRALIGALTVALVVVGVFLAT